MLVELALIPFFLFIKLLVSLFPILTGQFNLDVTSLFDLIEMGLYFFGKTTFCAIVMNFTFWAGVDIVWLVIEWVYKKIPGVN